LRGPKAPSPCPLSAGEGSETWPASNTVPMRLPNNLNLSFGNVDGEALLLAMGSLAVSSGAACTSTDTGPSHVLLALGLSEAAARSSLRFGLGRFNAAADIAFAADQVVSAVRRLRQLGSWPAGTKTG